MRETDLISTLIVHYTSEGEGAVAAGATTVAAGMDKAAAAAAALGAATETSARRQASSAAAFNAMARSMDPAARAYADLERNVKTLGQAMSQNSSQFDKAGQSLTVYAEKLHNALVAAEALRRQQSNLITDPSASTGSIKGIPMSLNQITGSQLSNVNAKTYAAEYEAMAKAQDMVTASALKLRTAINPLEAEQGKLAAEMRQYKVALDAGAISQQEFAAAHAMAGKRLGDFAQNLKTAGTAGRVMSGEMTNLGFQLNDIVTGLALGQSPFMILAQQGGQVVQIFTSSKASIADFARSSMGWFTSLFTAGRVAFGGIATAIGTVIYANASYISSQREVSQALIGIGAKTQTTAAQINDFAKQNASATGLSVDQARSVAIEFTKTGNIAVAGINGVGEAVHGFSILTGQSAEESSKAFAKAFSGSIVSGAEELNKTYGFLNASTRDYIRSLELQGDRSGAIQVVINAIAKDNISAADSVSLWAKAYDALANAASKAKNAIGAGTAPQSNEDQLAALERQKAQLEKPSQGRFTDPANLITGLFSGMVAPPGLDAVNKMIDALKEKIAGVKAGNLVKELDAVSLAGDNVVRSIIPQIGKIEELEAALQKLNAAQNEPGVVPGTTAGPQQEAARTALNNQLQALRESQAEAARYNIEVQKIAASWGGVSQSTALALQAAQNDIPVIQAITGDTQRAAQYAADYANALVAGKAPADALALSASNLEKSTAAAHAAAEKQIAGLTDQLKITKATSDASKESAQRAKDYNDAIRGGATAADATALAIAQAAIRTAEGSKAALEWQQNMLGVGAAATQAADAAQRAADAFDAAVNAEMAAQGGRTGGYASGDFSVTGGSQPSSQSSSLSNAGYQLYLNSLHSMPSVSDQINTALSTGGIDAAIAAAMKGASSSGGGGLIPLNLAGSVGGNGGFLPAPTTDPGAFMSQLNQLYNLKNAQTSDKSVQLANDQQFLSWLQTRPQTIAVQQQMASLISEMKSLSGSTNSLNSTMKEALSPYYFQDPRTSHLGFRAPGMASGGEFTVPGGYSANDNLTASIPVASGEIVSVRRPGQNAGSGQAIYVTNHITIGGGANKDEVGRTMYQLGQTMAKQIAAGGR